MEQYWHVYFQETERKESIIDIVLDTFNSLQPPGRFLRLVERLNGTATWEELPENLTRDKIKKYFTKHKKRGRDPLRRKPCENDVKFSKDLKLLSTDDNLGNRLLLTKLNRHKMNKNIGDTVDEVVSEIVGAMAREDYPPIRFLKSRINSRRKLIWLNMSEEESRDRIKSLLLSTDTDSYHEEINLPVHSPIANERHENARTNKIFADNRGTQDNVINLTVGFTDTEEYYDNVLKEEEYVNASQGLSSRDILQDDNLQFKNDVNDNNDTKTEKAQPGDVCFIADEKSQEIQPESNADQTNLGAKRQRNQDDFNSITMDNENKTRNKTRHQLGQTTTTRKRSRSSRLHRMLTKSEKETTRLEERTVHREGHSERKLIRRLRKAARNRNISYETKKKMLHSMILTKLNQSGENRIPIEVAHEMLCFESGNEEEIDDELANECELLANMIEHK